MTKSVAFDAWGNPITTDGTFKFQDVAKDRPEGGRPHTGLTVRAHEGAQRLIVGGNADTWREVENLRAEKFNAYSDLKAGPGVSGSARGALAAPIAAGSLKDDSLVQLGPEHGNMTTTAASAARLGVLRKLPTGGYEDTHAPVATPAAQPQAAPQVAPIDTYTALEDDGSAAVFKHGVAPALAARAVEEMASSGQMSPDVIREAAQQLDADPSMVVTAMNNAMRLTVSSSRDTRSRLAWLQATSLAGLKLSAQMP